MFNFPPAPAASDIDLAGDVLDDYRKVFKERASEYVRHTEDPYTESVSIHQRAKKYFGTVWETIWEEEFQRNGIEYVAQPPSSSQLRADFKVGNYVIDMTLSIRERGDGKLKYKQLYPGCTVVIVSNDTKISSERVAYFHKHGVRLVLRPELSCHYPSATSFHDFIDEISVQPEADNQAASLGDLRTVALPV